MALQLGFAALGIFAVLLPFQPFFPPITSGIVAFWLVYLLSFTTARFALLRSNKFVWLFALYFLWMLAGFAYTTNRHEAGLDLTLKISLLLWPLGVATWPELIAKFKHHLLVIFLASLTLSAAVLSAIAFVKWSHSGLPFARFFEFTATWTWLPNHYVALYCSFGILIGLNLALKKQLRWPWALAAISVLLLYLVLASVRIQFIALPFALVVFVFALRGDVPLRKKLWPIAGLLGLLLTLALLLPSSRNRLSETLDELRSMHGMVNNKQTNHRVFIWQYGWQVSTQHFWLGTGTGAADDALHEKLKTCTAQFWNGERTYLLAEKKYNYHNEFLQHFATHGVVGLLLLLLIFVLPIITTKWKIDALQSGFLALVFVAWLTESMLERQAGVLFFGFFYALLFVVPRARNEADF